MVNMLEWVCENAGTLAVGVLLATAVTLAAIRLIHSRKQGSCSGSCSGCAMRGECQTADKSQTK